MRKPPYDPISKGIQSRMYEEAKTHQEAYALLQSGLKRRRQSEQLLTAEELKAILPYRQKLVMSTQERWLLDESKKMIEQQRIQRRDRYLKGGGLAVGLLLVVSLAVLNLSGKATDEQMPAAKKVSLEKVPSPPVVNHRPLKEVPPAEPVLETTSGEIAEGETEAEIIPEDSKAEAGELQEKGLIEKPVNPFSYTIPVETMRGKILRVRKAGKWGLADTRYNVVLPLKYRRVRVLDASRGYFILELGEKRGIANASGKVLLPPKFDKLGDYYASEHLLVLYENGKAGVFDLRSGRPAIQLQSKSVSHLSGDMFGAQFSNGKENCRNNNEEETVPALYDAVVQNGSEERGLNQAGENFASLH